MIESLLSPEKNKLNRLSLQRIRLDQKTSSYDFSSAEIKEACFYVLTGTVDYHYSNAYMKSTGVLGAYREDVRFNRDISLLRCAPKSFSLHLRLYSYAADILVATCAPPRGFILPEESVLYQSRSFSHNVGIRTHHREVREVPTPNNFSIHCGETVNDIGAWSSWPSHATSEEESRYAEHEEVFFVVTPGYGLIRFDGVFCDGSRARGVHEAGNGSALVTPLGSHEIVFGPDSWGYYAWFYTSFLQKQYNKYATDGVKTYVK